MLKWHFRCQFKYAQSETELFKIMIKCMWEGKFEDYLFSTLLTSKP